MTVSINSICVYCSSSAHIDLKYKEPVHQFGQLLAKHNIKIVFGGGRVGLMGVVSDACMEAGGEVLGITTEYLDQYEIGSKNITKLIVVDSMEKRQEKMFDACDALVVLPGGFGTLAEFFDVLTRKQIGLHAKPIVIANFYGFWDPLKDLIHHIVKTAFASDTDETLCMFVDCMEDILPTLKKMPLIKVDPTEKWF
ncbi:MAG: TIGR00730 family Rossman fold protein [Alphaproteobacteria bacterium]